MIANYAESNPSSLFKLSESIILGNCCFLDDSLISAIYLIRIIYTILIWKGRKS